MIDSREPMNIVSSISIYTLRLIPGINHQKVFGTEMPNLCTSIGAYSALPLRFEPLVFSLPEVALPSKHHDVIL